MQHFFYENKVDIDIFIQGRSFTVWCLLCCFNCIQQIHMDDSVDVFQTVWQLQIRWSEYCSTQVRFDGNKEEINTQNSISQSNASMTYLMTNSSKTKSKCRCNTGKCLNRKYYYICKSSLSVFVLECKPPYINSK